MVQRPSRPPGTPAALGKLRSRHGHAEEASGCRSFVSVTHLTPGHGARAGNRARLLHRQARNGGWSVSVSHRVPADTSVMSTALGTALRPRWPSRRCSGRVEGREGMVRRAAELCGMGAGGAGCVTNGCPSARGGHRHGCSKGALSSAAPGRLCLPSGGRRRLFQRHLYRGRASVPGCSVRSGTCRRAAGARAALRRRRQPPEQPQAPAAGGAGPAERRRAGPSGGGTAAARPRP